MNIKVNEIKNPLISNEDYLNDLAKFIYEEIRKKGVNLNEES